MKGILIFDTDGSVSETITSLLLQRAYEPIHLVRSREKAIELLTECPHVTLVITNHPGLIGYVRSAYPERKTLYISGRGESEVATIAAALETPYLVKPLELKKLCESIKTNDLF